MALVHLFHACGGGARARVELADVGVGEPVLPHERHRGLKILVGLARESTDDVCGQLQARHQLQQRVCHSA